MDKPEISALDNKIQELINGYTRLKEKYRTLQEQHDQLETEHLELQEILSNKNLELEEKERIIQDSVNTAADNLKEKTRIVEEQNEQLKVKQAALDSLNSEVAVLNEVKIGLESEYGALKAQFSQLRTQCDLAHNHLAQKNDVIAQLEKKVKELEDYNSSEASVHAKLDDILSQINDD